MTIMRRQFGDVPPLVSNVGITTDGKGVVFPDGTLELDGSGDLDKIYVLPEMDEWHLVRYMSVKDRFHGTILVRLYDTDDRYLDLTEAVNRHLRAMGEIDRIPKYAQ